VARKTNLSVHTLRYYERIGFLKKLRTTGMPIAKMKEFVELTRRGDGTVVERRALLEEHDRAVERAIEELSENRGTNLQKYGATASHRETPDENSPVGRAMFTMVANFSALLVDLSRYPLQ